MGAQRRPRQGFGESTSKLRRNWGARTDFKIAALFKGMGEGMEVGLDRERPDRVPRVYRAMHFIASRSYSIGKVVFPPV